MNFNLIVIVLFKIQSAGVQSQNNNKFVTLPILLELTVKPFPIFQMCLSKSSTVEEFIIQGGMDPILVVESKFLYVL